MPAPAPAAARPVVLVPGFGVIPEGFQAAWEALHGRTELWYVETREKASSRLAPRADMGIERSARDLARVLSLPGLAGRDLVLVGVCWGGTIVLEGILRGIVEAPTVLVADPMHTLWFPKWVLRWVSPLLPLPLVRALRPLLFHAMLGDMEEEAQKERDRAFVFSADIGKWKRAAEASRDVELHGRLHAIGREVLVLNGTADKVHDPRDYPLLAAEMPRGRFLSMPAAEHERERLFGTAARELALADAADGLPPSLVPFEVPLDRAEEPCRSAVPRPE